MPLTQELLQRKLQTNSRLSAANLTACDFWMAFLFHLSIPIFSLSSLRSLLSCQSRLCQGRKASSLPFPSLWVFPSWGIEYLVIVRGKVTSTLIFHSCRLPSPVCVWPRDPVLCPSPWWMRRPCSSTYCWQPVCNHCSSLLTPPDLSDENEECPYKKRRVCVCVCVCVCVLGVMQHIFTPVLYVEK